MFYTKNDRLDANFRHKSTFMVMANLGHKSTFMVIQMDTTTMYISQENKKCSIFLTYGNFL